MAQLTEIVGVRFIERGVKAMDAVQLIEEASAFRRVARESGRYALDRLKDRGLADLVPLLEDAAEVTDCALGTLERGQLRREVWQAAHQLAGEVESACRAIGSDGQMLRCADRAAGFSGAWSTVADRLGEEARQAARTPQPDPATPAPEDPALTEAIKETFPASDPIAVPDRG